MILELKLLKFLKKHLQEHATLLVALSGGPDSLSLAHLLLQFRKKMSFTFEVAHVDHKVRFESAKEAKTLKEWAKKNQIPFHLKELENVPSKNQEDFFRKKRYEFFKQLFRKKDYRALLLAHHQNDLEETVLKRVLEGATFENLAPLREQSCFEKMNVWRPLLDVSKVDILEYVKKEKLQPFIDPTNFDKSNLRSKMREEIIPNLENAFGKNIRSSLLALSKLSESFESYMESVINLEEYMAYSKIGTCFDLSGGHFHPFELQYGLKKCLKRKKIDLNRQELLKAVYWIINKACSKKCIKRDKTLYFDRGRILILPTPKTELPDERVLLKEGRHFFGNWEVLVKKEESEKKVGEVCWKNIFKKEGAFSIQIPYGEYFLRKINLKDDQLFFGSRLKKLLQRHLVPSCLVHLLPVIESEKKIVAEFFTGKIISNPEKNGLNIYLSYKKD